MTGDVLIIKNSTLEGPGLIEYVIMENDICWDIIDLERGDEFPLIKKFQGIFVMGDPNSASDNNLKIKKVSSFQNLNIYAKNRTRSIFIKHL